MAQQLRILLVGNGGREHALAWKLAQSNTVELIHIVPGNGGTAAVPKCTNIADVKASDFAGLVKHANTHSLNFLVPGPEAPLVAGIVDYFNEHAPAVRCFGPNAAAARMEGSKAFSKEFMQRHNIPTARYANFDSYDAALQHLQTIDYRVVIKADGLAAGKGVIIPQNHDEAVTALQDIMQKKDFGDAGDVVVVEEFLEGDEISILSLSDGESILSLPPAQDHKRIGDGDTGPNTGGMGTYAPAPIASASVLQQIDATVLQPTIRGMKQEGMPFVGCLFSGFMLTAHGPRVLEYNVRFGDPETQSCLALLDSDLAEIMSACTTVSLSSKQLSTASRSACTVVVAAGGYPGSYAKDIPMTVTPPSEDNVFVFHAGTTIRDAQLRTDGGRVIAVTATDATLAAAVEKAYRGVQNIEFKDMQFRRDIARRALQ